MSPYGRLDTKAKKDSVRRNFFRGGRNTILTKRRISLIRFLTKIPALDFATVNIKYQATYRWIGASRLAVELGNFLENGLQKGTVQLDLERLYQKSKWLRQLDVPSKAEDKERWKNRITKIRDSDDQDRQKCSAPAG